ncbi:MAG: lycopene cyclase family protein [Aquirufa antheringensis]|nr:lycopene cyclase family protein [Aquirufa antheringensis]
MPTLVYDIAIIGAGASGLQLLYELTQANPKQKILLLDSGDRSAKSWCFWENKDASCFPFLIEKSWDSMLFKTSKGESITSEINPLAYHYISSSKFFTYFFEDFIPANTNITHLNTWVSDLQELPTGVKISCKNGQIYQAKKVADSRPVKSTEPNLIFQHFSGKFIEFEEPILDDTCMTLMDFSLPASTPEMAVFHYILPFSKTKALIETTVFTRAAYDQEAYEKIWQKYMDLTYANQKYTVLSNETGTIPMGVKTQKKEGPIFTIGAAGGNIKASTGYAFTRMHADAIDRAQNRSSTPPARFHFYDKMLLKIMQNEMIKIPEVMDRLFTRVPKKEILNFLDDKTSLIDEIKLLSQLDIPLFIKHLLR